MSGLELLPGFFGMGLLGGFGHCTGMCGPFVLFISSTCVDSQGRPPGLQRLLRPQLQYHLGRIITYAILGALVAGIGRIAGTLMHIQPWISLGAGALLLIAGAGGLFGRFILSGLESTRLLDRILQQMRKRAPRSALALGLLLGLLPCGILYGALAGALAMPSALAGALAMASFGLGTSFGLLSVAIAGNAFAHWRVQFFRVAYALMLLMGAWFMYDGWTHINAP